MRIIAGTHRGRKLKAPDTIATRPILDQQKESLFNILREAFPCPGVLDIFAGSGALGFEALSRGAEMATFVERGREALTALRENMETLDLKSRARIVVADALRLDPSRLEHPYTVAFLDPPFPLVTAETARLAELLDRVLRGRAEDDEGCVMLRVPTAFHRTGAASWPGDCFDQRTFGESHVLLLR
ncbi:MAG TPA: 16S rRNA (guanine(966)-N(2))-methyltransferase RsmD [Planctomycetota bacterium]|nr:16S rRNA (guanine(966)-N(2))-methyltransferase RsmD [Planctomycetota bacterium]